MKEVILNYDRSGLLKVAYIMSTKRRLLTDIGLSRGLPKRPVKKDEIKSAKRRRKSTLQSIYNYALAIALSLLMSIDSDGCFIKLTTNTSNTTYKIGDKIWTNPFV